MKRLVIVLSIIVLTVFIVSSCNDHVCPAYSDNAVKTEQSNT